MNNIILTIWQIIYWKYGEFNYSDISIKSERRVLYYYKKYYRFLHMQILITNGEVNYLYLVCLLNLLHTTPLSGENKKTIRRIAVAVKTIAAPDATFA